MLDSYNNKIRNGLMNLVKADIGDSPSSLGITKVVVISSKSKPKDVIKEEEAMTSLLTLQSLEDLELDLTREQTVMQTPEMNSLDSCYRSYKYLKDLSQRVKEYYTNRVRKARSSLFLPQMPDRLMGEVLLHPRNEKKRNSGALKRSDCNLALVRLYPCESDDYFKIDLIKCERY
jgi:hypothetical protein